MSARTKDYGRNEVNVETARKISHFSRGVSSALRTDWIFKCFPNAPWFHTITSPTQENPKYPRVLETHHIQTQACRTQPPLNKSLIMKSTTYFLLLLLSTFASSELLSCFRGQQAILDGPYPVPGNSSFTFCKDPKDYSLNIESLNISLDTSQRYVYASPALKVWSLIEHSPLIVNLEASLDFTKPVEKGSYVLQTFKYDGIILGPIRSDLCDALPNINLKCPVDGSKTIKASVELPVEFNVNPPVIPGTAPKYVSANPS